MKQLKFNPFILILSPLLFCFGFWFSSLKQPKHFPRHRHPHPHPYSISSLQLPLYCTTNKLLPILDSMEFVRQPLPKSKEVQLFGIMPSDSEEAVVLSTSVFCKASLTQHKNRKLKESRARRAPESPGKGLKIPNSFNLIKSSGVFAALPLSLLTGRKEEAPNPVKYPEEDVPVSGNR